MLKSSSLNRSDFLGLKRNTLETISNRQSTLIIIRKCYFIIKIIEPNPELDLARGLGKNDEPLNFRNFYP